MKGDEFALGNLRLRTKFLKENATEVDEAARSEGTAVAMYWRLSALAGIAGATARDLAECSMVTGEHRDRVLQAQSKFEEADKLLRECYEAEMEQRKKAGK